MCHKVLVYYLFRMDGQLEFYDASEITLITTAEHTQATDLEWDPSGRYVVTSVSFWTQKVEFAIFCLWRLCMWIHIEGNLNLCFSITL